MADQFEAFFKRADLDNDGRISGAEAVSFFQGSALSKQLLAQIWMHADQNRAGFLGRQEFYNALKLVTVAQSKRDLTPEIVKAALYGPASAKIPPPQINLPPSPVTQSPSVPGSPPIQMGAMGPTGSQTVGYRGPIAPTSNLNQHYYPSQANQLVRPSQGPLASATPRPMQSVPGLPNSGVGISPTGLTNTGMRPSLGGLAPNISSSGLSTPGFPSSGMSNSGLSNSGILTGWLDGKSSGAPLGLTSQLPSRGISPSMPLDELMSSDAVSQNSMGTSVSRDGFSSNSIGGADPFAAFQLTKSGSSPAISSLSNNPNFSAIGPVSIPTSASSVPTQPLSASRSLDSLQSAFAKQPLGGQSEQVHNYSKLSPPVPQTTSSGAPPGISAGAGFATSDPSQSPWPKMTTSGVQKYTKVFMEVDTDRDGKITGEQARNLFLSWRLPRGRVLF